jgi:oxygen-independent coproporphyrinogen-3 oxidase
MTSGAAPERSGLALYIHWPFCVAKCPYCDFNSHVRERIDAERWHASYLASLQRAADEIGPRRLASIFFGGGTPSLMPPRTVAALIDHARALWPFADEIEITLEANPSASEAERFAALRAAGVNRLSLGIQALDEDSLRFLGRTHSLPEALAALARAQAIFPRTSFDMIYARPGQSVAQWDAELRRAISLGTEHLSVYQLTIEPGTAFFGAHRRAEFSLPDDDLAADLLERTQDVLGAAGMPAYEISNHARPGAECRHNMTYWRYGEYLGIGPGAHGRLAANGGREATRHHRLPETWLAAVEAGGSGEAERAPLDRSERGREMLLMGLRLSEGVDRTRFAAETGKRLEEFVAGAVLDRLVKTGLLECGATALRATRAGRQRLDSVLRALLA